MICARSKSGRSPIKKVTGLFRRALPAALASATAGLWTGPAIAAFDSTLGGTVSYFPISTTAYGTDDTNSCAVSRNDLVTVGTYQYAAFYQYVNNGEGTIYVARRNVSGGAFSLVNTHYNVSSTSDSLYSGAIDDHDIVAMAVDGNGDMHLSWGMHNIALNYAISTPVNGRNFNPVFTTQTATNNPALFSEFTADGISQVTYPEFYSIPNSNGSASGNLIFDYRNAASLTGGGSGNGNTYFNTYNYSSSSFANPHEVLDGGITSVNGYQNRLVYDSAGNLDMTWTWRSTPNFQTNNNIMFAQSPNNGATWYPQGSTTPYTLPIIASTANGGTASQVAQIVEQVAQNSSLINQASMTVDKNNNPVLATWLTPGGNASLPVSGTNNPNLQYELIYYNGSSWQMSQITHRTSDTSFDQGGSFVRDLGRPIVLVDSSNRVLVVTRSEDTGMGTYGSATTPNNNLVVYWNTMASLDSATPGPWKSFSLAADNMGEYEPSYDQPAWSAGNVLSLFYEPVGLSGQTTGTAQVLQWNESSFNFSAAAPSVVTWDANTTTAGVQDGSGVWNLTGTNFSDGFNNYAWSPNFSQSAIFGAANGSAGIVTLGANITVSSLFFNPAGAGSYNIAGGGFTLTLTPNPTIVANTNATISAPISTSGTVTKTGVGTLTLSGTNSIAGTLQIGTFAVSGGNANGAVCVTSAGALGGVTTVVLPDNNSAYAVFQLYAPGGGITLPATVAFSIDANNAGPNATGATILESIDGTNVIQGPITFNVGGKGYGIAVDTGSLTLTSNLVTTAHTIFLRGAGLGSLSGNISGVGSIESDGPGTWTFAGANTYTGTTNVSGGSLNLAAGASITSTALTVGLGGTLNVAGTLATGTALVTGGIVNLQPGTGGILNRTISSLSIAATGSVAIQPAPSANRTVLDIGTLTFAGTPGNAQGLLDTADNDLDLPGASLTTVTSLIAQGYNAIGGAKWTGAAGITSTAAAADTTHVSALAVIQNNQSGSPLFTSVNKFDGIAPAPSDILVRYTYFGDANLDGKVDGSDYTLIDTGYPSNGTKTGWYFGDFNYDGTIDGSDYALIDNAFNNQGPAIIPTVLTAEATVDQAVAAIAPVPEPTTVSVAALCALGLTSLRRRRAPQRANQLAR